MTTKMDREVMVNLAESYLLKSNTSIKEEEIREGILKAYAILNKLIKDMGLK